eukprot:scaffold2560_cov116-Isochrysis_galbana.AAC.1
MASGRWLRTRLSAAAVTPSVASNRSLCRTHGATRGPPARPPPAGVDHRCGQRLPAPPLTPAQQRGGGREVILPQLRADGSGAVEAPIARRGSVPPAVDWRAVGPAAERAPGGGGEQLPHKGRQHQLSRPLEAGERLHGGGGLDPDLPGEAVVVWRAPAGRGVRLARQVGKVKRLPPRLLPSNGRLARSRAAGRQFPRRRKQPPIAPRDIARHRACRQQPRVRAARPRQRQLGARVRVAAVVAADGACGVDAAGLGRRGRQGFVVRVLEGEHHAVRVDEAEDALRKGRRHTRTGRRSSAATGWGIGRMKGGGRTKRKRQSCSHGACVVLLLIRAGGACRGGASRMGRKASPRGKRALQDRGACKGYSATSSCPRGTRGGDW